MFLLKYSLSPCRAHLVLERQNNQKKIFTKYFLLVLPGCLLRKSNQVFSLLLHSFCQFFSDPDTALQLSSCTQDTVSIRQVGKSYTDWKRTFSSFILKSVSLLYADVLWQQYLKMMYVCLKCIPLTARCLL